MSDTAPDWVAVKLPPRLTGLPVDVWITQSDGDPHGMVRPADGWAAADAPLLAAWIERNRDVILDYWNGLIEIDEALPRLRRLP